MGFKVKVLPTLLSTFAFPQRCFITISCHRVILFHNLFFNPAVIVLHEVDALNRCCQSLAIYSITSVLLNFGLCYYVTNISGIELYDIFKYTPWIPIYIVCSLGDIKCAVLWVEAIKCTRTYTWNSFCIYVNRFQTTAIKVSIISWLSVLYALNGRKVAMWILFRYEKVKI